MSGHRQAALALHALGADDQDLILAELPDADQERLRAYLAELTELGFDLPAADSAPAPARLVSIAKRAPGTPQERVQGADARSMAELLAGEPAGLVAQLLSGGEWPWRAPFMAQLPAARRAQVLAALEAQQAPGPACAAVLVDALAERLERVVHLEEQPAPAARPAWSRLLAKAGAWTR